MLENINLILILNKNYYVYVHEDMDKHTRGKILRHRTKQIINVSSNFCLLSKHVNVPCKWNYLTLLAPPTSPTCLLSKIDTSLETRDLTDSRHFYTKQGLGVPPNIGSHIQLRIHCMCWMVYFGKWFWGFSQCMRKSTSNKQCGPSCLQWPSPCLRHWGM